MAIITVANLKAHLGLTDAVDDTPLTTAVNAANAMVVQRCRRSFDTDATATARIFRPVHNRYVVVNDIHTATDLVVKTDDDDDGTFETTIAAADYQLEPLNGVVDGESGWPYTAIRAVESDTFLMATRRASVQVTAKWGWAAVPGPVTQATLLVAARLFKRKDSPHGSVGFDEFALRVSREDPDVAAALEGMGHYRRDSVLFG